jgi:hypothetical protein
MVLRRLLQDHMDLRSVREPRLSEVRGPGRVVRRRIERGHQWLLTTVFGTVSVTRTACRALGGRGQPAPDGRRAEPAG